MATPLPEESRDGTRQNESKLQVQGMTTSKQLWRASLTGDLVNTASSYEHCGPRIVSPTHVLHRLVLLPDQVRLMLPPLLEAKQKGDIQRGVS